MVRMPLHAPDPILSVRDSMLSAVHASQPALHPAPRALTAAAVAGQLSELSGLGDTAGLTTAMQLVLDAQRQGEHAAWITRTDSTFFPVDAADNGVDLDALIVVRVPDAPSAARSADRLVRSGAFGLVVLDLGADEALLPAVSAALPLPWLARLGGLAQKHHTAVVCVTHKAESAPSLGSLVVLRGHARREHAAPDRFACVLRVLKDKHHGPWTGTEAYFGPAGLR